MRTAYAYGGFTAFHQLSQQSRAFQHGQAQLHSFHTFRVVWQYGHGIHNQIGAVNILRFMADYYRYAHLPQSRGRIGFQVVTAG